MAVASLAVSSSAAAVQTDQYDVFSRCPTDAPALNDPASDVAVCAAGTAQAGELKIGALAVPLAHLDLQFAAIGLGIEEPDCPEAGLCFGRVPDSTTLESTPTAIVVGPPGRKGWRRGGHGWRGKGLRLKVTLEAAGDVSQVSPGFLFELPIPLFRLPIKLHVEAPWLSRNCYVGSDDEPILWTPLVVGPPASFDFAGDPNGFNTEVLTFTGLPLLDQSLSLPAASGCTEGRRGHHRSRGIKDRWVNGLLGVPSAAGANELSIPSVHVGFAAAGFDGASPDGGAELQASFDAAK